jgi:polygalacturonase
MFNVLDFGAMGDGVTNDSESIQKAIDSCSKDGGGTVLFPSGKVFLTGPFQIKSNVNLHIEGNALIKASTDESLYTESAFKENRSEGSIWISARNASNISITGTGRIDGQGMEFMLNEEPTHYNYKMENGIDVRPHLLVIIGSANVTIRDITFSNAAYWCIHPIGCDDVLISGVRILNSLKVRNSDGIDLDHCRNVRISDCYIESADDCICLKTRREYDEYGPTENVTVTGCVLVSTSCAIKLGSENVNGIRNVVFSSIIISSSNRGLGIQNRDEGIIENITFSNIQIESRLFADVWWGKAEPIYITTFFRADDEYRRFAPGQVKGNVGEVRNIKFYNISCISENGIYLSGCDAARLREILFDNVQIEINKISIHEGGLFDRRPCDVEGLIAHGTSGFHLNSAEDVEIRNCRVSWGENRPVYYSHVVYAKDVNDLFLENIRGYAAHDTMERILIED